MSELSRVVPARRAAPPRSSHNAARALRARRLMGAQFSYRPGLSLLLGGFLGLCAAAPTIQSLSVTAPEPASMTRMAGCSLADAHLCRPAARMLQSTAADDRDTPGAPRALSARPGPVTPSAAAPAPVRPPSTPHARPVRAAPDPAQPAPTVAATPRPARALPIPTGGVLPAGDLVRTLGAPVSGGPLGRG
jgi:hypothetical protein